MEVPPVKNFVINEKDRSQFKEATQSELGSQGGRDSEIIQVSSQRKSFVIITIIVFLAAVFAVGIYFAIDLSLT